jgi:hypothetical protein
MAVSGVAVVMSIHNGRLAYGGDRSFGWALAGLVVGTGALSLAAADDAEVAAFDVAAGMAAVVTSLARMPRSGGDARIRSSQRDVGIQTGYRSLGVRIRF